MRRHVGRADAFRVDQTGFNGRTVMITVTLSVTTQSGWPVLMRLL
jgi:hypothetical protein